MAKLTFLEVHLEGSSLTANAPFSADRPEDEPPETPDVESSADGGGRRGVAVLVGLAFLLVVALAVRRWVAGDEEIDLA